MKAFNFVLFQLVIPVMVFILITASEGSATSDQPFNNSSNWGGTGLMEIPNARILEDGVVRLEGTQALPFRWFSGGMASG